MPLQNIVDSFDAGEIFASSALHDAVNSPGTPAGILLPELQYLSLCFR